MFFAGEYLADDDALEAALDGFYFLYPVGFQTYRSQCFRHFFRA